MNVHNLTAKWESEVEHEMWPLELRIRLRDEWDINFIPWLINKYVLGWRTFNARGETCVTCIRGHMEFGTDPELFNAAWVFLCKLQLEDRIVYRRPGSSTPTT